MCVRVGVGEMMPVGHMLSAARCWLCNLNFIYRFLCLCSTRRDRYGFKCDEILVVLSIQYLFDNVAKENLKNLSVIELEELLILFLLIYPFL